MNIDKRKNLENIIINEGKIVNRRFRTLEKIGYTEASNAYKYNEKKAFDNTRNYYKIKNGKFSYRTDVQNIKNGKTLEGLANEIHKSYISKSLTKRDIDKSYKQGAKTLNQRYGTNYTASELGELFRVAKETNLPYGSDEIINLRKRTNLSQDELIDFLQNNSFTRTGLREFVKQAEKYKVQKNKKSVKFFNRKKDRGAKRRERRLKRGK